MSRGSGRWLPAAGLSISLAAAVVIVLGLSRFSAPVYNAVLVYRTAYLEANRAYPKALVYLETWKGRSPPSIDHWRRDLTRASAVGALLSGQFREACSYFDLIADVDNPLNGSSTPDYFVRLYRGISYEKLGQVTDARADWNTAITAFPRRHDAFIARGHSRLLEGDLLGAHADYLQALELSGQLGIVYVDIGDAWRAIGRNDLARRMYRRGMSVDPGDVFCRLRLAEMALRMDNDPRTALNMCRQIQRMMPDLVVVEILVNAARDWEPGKPLPHIPAARFESGTSRHWKVPPSKILFEFFREAWKGWP